MWAGLDPNFTSKLVAVRGALDMACEEAIKGSSTKELTQHFRKGVGLVRQGRFDKLRLGLLLDKQVDGSKQDTLIWEVTKESEPCEAILRASARLIEVVAVVHPQAGSTALTFFNALANKLVEQRKKGVDWGPIAKYHLGIMRRISTNPRNFFIAIPGAVFVVAFNVSLLSERSDELVELEEARLKAIAGGTRKRDDDGKSGGKPDKKQKTGGGQPNAVRAAGVAAGAAVPRPPPKDAQWDTWKTQHPLGPSQSGKHQNRPACWDFHHPQGCKLGDKCDFHHGK